MVGLDICGIWVWFNCGVVGIDGIVFIVIGVVLVYEGVYECIGSLDFLFCIIVLIGDLMFVYDSFGLLIGLIELILWLLIIVVFNDNGGGIFELFE